MKVGDYVRTKDGRIFKWNKLCTIDKKDYEEHTRKILFAENEIKSSPRVIDLIEVGDYVNGHLVSYVGSDSIEVFWYKDEKQWLDKEDIKSIVTKKQFRNMEYKIGE